MVHCEVLLWCSGYKPEGFDRSHVKGRRTIIEISAMSNKHASTRKWTAMSRECTDHASPLGRSGETARKRAKVSFLVCRLCGPDHSG